MSDVGESQKPDPNNLLETWKKMELKNTKNNFATYLISSLFDPTTFFSLNSSRAMRKIRALFFSWSIFPISRYLGGKIQIFF